MTTTAYRHIIRDLNPTVNAAGVEADMGLRHGTLDHPSREDFWNEIGIAKRCRATGPSFLEPCAKTYGYGDAFVAERNRPIES